MSQATFSAPRKSVLAAFASAGKIAPRRSIRDVAKLSRLSVNGSIDVGATDFDVSQDLRFDWQRSGEDVVLVDPRKLTKILRESKALTVSATIDGDTLRLDLDGATVKVPIERPDAEALAWPEWGPTADPTATFVVDAAALREALRMTIFATDTESSRYAYGGIAFAPEKDGSLVLAATDGRRLAFHPLPLTFGELPTDLQTFVVPNSAAAALLQSLPSDGPVSIGMAVTVETTERHNFSGKATGEIDTKATVQFVRFDWSGGCVRSRLVEGRFPRWRDVTPDVARNRDYSDVKFDAAEALAAWKIGGAAATEESRGVDWICGPADQNADWLSTRVESCEGSAATFPVRGTRFDPILFDPRFVTEWLALLPKKSEVTAWLKDGESAMLLECGDSRHLLMPLARDRQA